MAAFTSIAAGIGAATALAGTTASVVNTRNAQADAKKQAREAARQQQAIQDRMKAEMDGREKSANMAADRARQRQMALASGAYGRRSTIHTGPLGLVGEPAVAQKTLLGT